MTIVLNSLASYVGLHYTKHEGQDGPVSLTWVQDKFGLSVQEKLSKIHFQDDGCGGHPGFLIGTILAIFDLQVAQIHPTKFPVNKHFKFKLKIDLQDGFLIKTILTS